ncbi:unnamed protein product [Polarella glacialis]|nr:unnamed protein product [Polarella glacialis]
MLVCRSVLGRSLLANGHRGPRLYLNWESGQFGCIVDGDDERRTFVFPYESSAGIYPEYAIFLSEGPPGGTEDASAAGSLLH